MNRAPGWAPRVQSDAQVVARFSTRGVHQGFVAAFAAACRDGVPVVKMTGHRLVVGAGATALVEMAAAQRRSLQLREQELQTAIERAKKAYLTAVSEEDADEYRKVEVEKKLDLQHVRKQLLGLRASKESEPALTFEADVSLLAEALSNVAEHDGAFTRAQVDAFAVVVPTLRIVPGPDMASWVGEATVRLPIEGGIAEVGPIRWPVRSTLRGSGAAQLALGVAPRDDRRRPTVVGALMDHGVGRDAAQLLVKGPPQLRALLEADGDVDRLPTWVGPQWRQTAFVEHVLGVYRAKPFPWGQAAYARTDPVRQAIADVLADNGGSVFIDELPSLVPHWPGTRIVGLQIEERRIQRTRPWRAPFTVAQRDGRRTLEAIRCVCGRAAQTVLRVPELPGDLLCSCGRVPDPERWALDPVVRFPEEYLAMRLPRSVWEVDLEAKESKRLQRLSTPVGRESVVLAYLHDGAWRTSTEVSGACNIPMTSIVPALRRMERRRVLASAQHDGRTRWAAVPQAADAPPTKPPAAL